MCGVSLWCRREGLGLAVGVNMDVDVVVVVVVSGETRDAGWMAGVGVSRESFAVCRLPYAVCPCG